MDFLKKYIAVICSPLSLALFLPLFLTACYEDFNPDVDVTPVLCINSLITAGQPVDVDVSRTWLYTDETAARDHEVNDAKVMVYANGHLVSDDYVAREGDNIRIEVESAHYGNAEAEVTVPYAVPVESFDWKPVLTSSTVGDEGVMSASLTFNLEADLTFSDPVYSQDFYHLRYIGFYNSGDSFNGDEIWGEFEPEGADFILGSLKYDAEPVFSEHIGVFESVMGSSAGSFTFFTDRQFQGSSYTLWLRFSDCRYSVYSKVWNPLYLECGYTITLYSVSKSYYDWSNYVWHNDEGFFCDLSDVGFSDPVWAYSNVSTGAGVVAACAPTTVTVDLTEFIKSSIISH